jgi:hypothetical protein
MADEDEGFAATAWGGGCDRPHRKTESTEADAKPDPQSDVVLEKTIGVLERAVAQNPQPWVSMDNSQLLSWLIELRAFRTLNRE